MLNNTKIFVIDFEDSFTFNIASELYKHEKNIEVISHTDFFSNEFFNLIIGIKQNRIAVILGPGPGHPNTFSNYFDKIRILKTKKNIFILGICLGHQIISLINGFKVRPSIKPLHGNQVKIDFNSKNILVQRYNSLSVYANDSSSEELMVNKWDRGISYQFHPESVGTHNSRIFFNDLLDFVHSK
jgi:anthranilate/para-aminobenzoate synthase component II